MSPTLIFLLHFHQSMKQKAYFSVSLQQRCPDVAQLGKAIANNTDNEERNNIGTGIHAFILNSEWPDCKTNR